jgi:rhodanese-related sulfurtransferase
MAVRRVTPQEAKALMDEGYVYVDVRSIPEFDKGHPVGAFNVPLMNMGPTGMTPNSDFALVMEKNFPKDARLIVGCKMGGRSAKAGNVLESLGYTAVVDQKGGYEGQPGDPGWVPAGLPVASQAAADRTYEALLAKTR